MNRSGLWCIGCRVRNHPFVDGNKRVGFGSIIVFFGPNGLDFDIPPGEDTAMVIGLVAGEIGEEGLARGIADNMPAASSRRS